MMQAAAGPASPDSRSPREELAVTIACGVGIVLVVLVIALPTPWGLGAFGTPPPAVSIVSFELNRSLPNPGGPAVTLTVQNTGSSAVSGLSAYLVPFGRTVMFPAVNADAPLTPRAFATASAIFVGPGPDPACGAVYPWTLSGNLSSGGTFNVTDRATFLCPPRAG